MLALRTKKTSIHSTHIHKSRSLTPAHVANKYTNKLLGAVRKSVIQNRMKLWGKVLLKLGRRGGGGKKLGDDGGY